MMTEQEYTICFSKLLAGKPMGVKEAHDFAAVLVEFEKMLDEGGTESWRQRLGWD